MKIVAYCRVSTDKEDQLNSLDTQKKFFEEFSKKHGYTLIRLYADEGITGTRLNKRTQFKRLMSDAGQGLFEMVVVKDISRFARNAVDFLQGIRYLKSLGIACNFVNASLSTQDSEMVLGTLALVAQEESANTSKRIKFSKKINAEKGRVPNIVYGYDKTKGDFFNLSINEFEAEIVRRIYGMYINDGHGANKISQILNDEGLKTKRGCKWSQNAVSRILSNPLYIGKIINGKEEVKDFLTGIRTKKNEEDWLIKEQPDIRILDDETFEQAQKILSNHKKAFNIKHERHSNKFLFSTIIKCRHCGYSFRRFEYTYANTYVRWSCSGRNTNGAASCPNRTHIDENEILDSIKAFFIGYLKDKQSLIKNVISHFNENYEFNTENAQLERELTSKLNILNNKKQKHIEMFQNDIIGMGELKTNTSKLNKDITTLENRLKIVRRNLSDGYKLEEVVNQAFGGTEDFFVSENITNSMLKSIIEKISVDEKGNVDIYLKLFSDIGLDNTFTFGYNST